MKKIIAIGVSAILLIAAAVAAVVFTLDIPLEKTISSRGYTINIPKDWIASSTGTICNKRGVEVGKFILINEEIKETQIAEHSGVTPIGDVKSLDFSGKIKKNEFNTDAGEVFQYYITDVPNPEPYAISLSLFRESLSKKLCDSIAKTLTIPEIGSNPPEKNISAPLYENLDDKVVYKVTLLDGSVMVKNIELLDAYIEKQSKSETTSLEILSYVQSGMGLMMLEDWSYIECDSGDGFMYSYYDNGDNIFTYDNNPTSFESIAKDAQSEKGITSYNLKVGEAITATLIEVPINLYRENLDELMSLKTDKSDVNHVLKIFEKIMTIEQFENITVTKEGSTLRIIFNKESVFNSAKLSKDAAIIFSLLSDIDTIEVEVKDGAFYVVKRNELSKGLKIAINKAAESHEKFSQFTEEIENIAPATPEINEAEAEVIYSATVVISSGSKITHPKTGKKVVVDGYAQKYGFAYCLDKPIECTVKRVGSVYIATATCEGTVVASQTLTSEAEVQKAIDTIKEYA